MMIITIYDNHDCVVNDHHADDDQNERCRAPCDEGDHKTLTDRCCFIQICFVSMMILLVGSMIMAFVISLG